MTSRKRKRLSLLALGMLALAGATALTLSAFQESIVFFYAPSEVATKDIPNDRRFRLGGLVQDGSVEKDGAVVRFKVTDGAKAVPVRYKGILPDLFREGQGVVTNGTLNGKGVFVADEVLAKHDEEYMPPEVAEALKKSGQWEGEGKMPDAAKSGMDTSYGN
jgi:cytochrome c-type biogenesis protein CcmE